MKRIAWMLVLLMAASPAWAAKKITVQELKEMLMSLQQAKKSDADMAAALAQVELSEQLGRVAMTNLSGYLPGLKSTEQVYVLEARSANLAPPVAELPLAPAPDAATQGAILAKAMDYATKVYAQLPHLAVTKSAFRFQDNIEPAEQGAKTQSRSKGGDSGTVDPTQIVHFVGAAETRAESNNGTEIVAASKEKKPTGKPGQVDLRGQGPVLSAILQDAQGAGSFGWLRWETVNGIQAAVFSFAVDKKKSRYSVDYCCFSVPIEGSELMNYGSNGKEGGVSTNPTTTIPAISGRSIVLPTGIQKLEGIEWRVYKATLPYHGKVFVDPASGTVLRLITETDNKPSDLLHEEAQRIDYGPVDIGGKTLVVPIKAVINAETELFINTGYSKYPTRHTLLTVDYKNYGPADAATGHN